MKFLFLLFVLVLNTSYNPPHSPIKKKKLLTKKTTIRENAKVIDKFNDVPVFFNGKMSNVHGRHLSESGYNLGLKWQCVEFVKRYYYSYFNHKMPNSYGHAKDFFNKTLGDVAFNPDRALMQYKNARSVKPKINDILVFNGNAGNPFGHIAIISNVTHNNVEIIQQNWGNRTRENFKLIEFQGYYTIADSEVLGWLRLPK